MQKDYQEDKKNNMEKNGTSSDESQEEKRAEMKETGSIRLCSNKRRHNIRLLTIIGEIEGHETVAGNTKSTKYIC